MTGDDRSCMPNCRQSCSTHRKNQEDFGKGVFGWVEEARERRNCVRGCGELRAHAASRAGADGAWGGFLFLKGEVVFLL